MPLLKHKEAGNQYRDQHSVNFSWNELENMTRSNLRQEFSDIPEVDRFLEEEYDPFIRDYLEEHGLDTSLIPRNMTVQYDPSGGMTNGGRAMHRPQRVVLGPDGADQQQIYSEEQPLTSCIGEEYIHEFGSNYFTDLEPSTRIEVEEVIAKQWQLFCEDNLFDKQGQQETLQEVESWYNQSPNYKPNAGTRIREMSENYLQQFESNNLSAEEHIQNLLSNPDIAADQYLNEYSRPSNAPLGQTVRQQDSYRF